MKTKIISLAILFSITATIGCNTKDEKKAETKTNEQTENTEVAEALKGRYGIKSGVVDYSASMAGTTTQQKLYFDDFGGKEAREITLDMMGQKMKTVTVIRDGFVYNYDLASKTGTKTALVADAANIDFNNLSKEIQDRMKIEKAGTENFLGKTCDKFTVNSSEEGVTGTYLVWQGIALKSDMRAKGMNVTLTADKVEENAAVDPAIFEIPKDIKFQ